MSNFSKTPRDAKEFQQKGLPGKLLLLGTNFMAGPLVLGFAGRWIDKKTGHEILFLTIGVILGIVWATYEAFKIAWYINRNEKSEKQNGTPD